MVPLHQIALSGTGEMCSVPLEEKGRELRGVYEPASEVLFLQDVLVGLGQYLPTMEDSKHPGSFVFGLMTSQVMCTPVASGHQNHGCFVFVFLILVFESGSYSVSYPSLELKVWPMLLPDL